MINHMNNYYSKLGAAETLKLLVISGFILACGSIWSSAALLPADGLI